MEEEHVLFVGILIDILACAIHTCDLEFVGRPTVVLKGIRYIIFSVRSKHVIPSETHSQSKCADDDVRCYDKNLH